MKKILFIVAALALVSVSANAQHSEVPVTASSLPSQSASIRSPKPQSKVVSEEKKKILLSSESAVSPVVRPAAKKTASSSEVKSLPQTASSVSAKATSDDAVRTSTKKK